MNKYSFIQRLKVNNHSIRCWPYPYQAGLSISNDAEFMNFNFFEILMKFLNTKSKTYLGDGLGLDISSSFFFYSAHSSNFSYFHGIDKKDKKQDYAGRLEDYIKHGWIDTIHGYGDFDLVGGFNRFYAQNCMDSLEKIGTKIPIFSNHGGIENIQNIGLDADYHCGDRKNHTAYHSDLLIHHGVRYIWTDSMITQRQQEKSSKNFRSFIVKFIRKHSSSQKIYSSNPSDVLIFAPLRDRSVFKGFRRFRSTGINAPNLSSLGYQIQQIPWEHFYQNHGAIILYQHFGVLYRMGGKCVASSIEAMKERPEVYLSPFYFLEQEFQSGRLWIASLADFLNYVDMVESITINKSEDGIWQIHSSKSIDDPQKYYQGLTIYVDPTKNIKLIANGKELAIYNNGPDENGYYSVSVIRKPKIDIWD